MKKITIGNKDVDWKIFMELTDKDIRNLCLVNKEMTSLFEDESFWEMRVKYRYGKKLVNSKKKYIGWRAYYAQRRREPHHLRDIVLKDLGLTWKRKLMIDENLLKHSIDRKINLGDLVAVVEKSVSDTNYWAYIVTDIKNGQATINFIDFIPMDETIAKVIFPMEATDIIIRLGSNSYTPFFNSLLKSSPILRIVIGANVLIFGANCSY